MTLTAYSNLWCILKTCVIEINDEVNCKLHGLELDTRKTLTRQFKYEIPHARYLPAVRLGRWDGKAAFFQLGGSTYVNLLPEIIPVLEREGYDLELRDNRNYTTFYEFDEVTENSFQNHQWPSKHPKAGEPILLRDYQVKIINDFLKNPQAIQEVATGAGKTLMTAALSHSISKYGRSLVVVPNKSLVTQTEADYKVLGLDVGVFYGDRKEHNHQHVICTWQSLNILLKRTKDHVDMPVTLDEFIEGVVCVIVDECFAGDTPVLTPKGYVPIRDLQPGDLVINYSEKTGKFKEDVVVKQHRNLTTSESEKMYLLEFDNGVKIEVTGNHKFLTNLGWCRADELTEQHEIINTLD